MGFDDGKGRIEKPKPLISTRTIVINRAKMIRLSFIFDHWMQERMLLDIVVFRRGDCNEA